MRATLYVHTWSMNGPSAPIQARYPRPAVTTASAPASRATTRVIGGPAVSCRITRQVACAPRPTNVSTAGCLDSNASAPEAPARNAQRQAVRGSAYERTYAHIAIVLGKRASLVGLLPS